MSVFKRIKNSHRLNLLIQKLAKICLVLVAVLLVIAWYIIDKIKPVRIYNIGRIANFGLQLRFPEHYLREISIEHTLGDGSVIRKIPEDKLHIFFVYAPANQYLLSMLEREVKVVNSRLLCSILEYMAPILRKTPFFRDDHHIKNDSEHFKRYVIRKDGRRPIPALHFSSQELENGRRWLENLHIDEKEWWFCFHNRDEAFYSRDTNLPRNASVKSYLKAVDTILETGGYAFRMGSVAEEKLDEHQNPRIIDYVNQHRSEFLDLFILGHCRFLLGNTSGVRMVPLIFNRPVALTNELCIIPRSLSDQDLWIPTQIRDLRDNSYLPFSKRLELEKQRNQQYRKLYVDGTLENYQIEPNNSDDIADIASDMLAKLNNEPLNEDDRYRLKAFQEIIGHRHSYQLGPSFLRRWEDLLT